MTRASATLILVLSLASLPGVAQAATLQVETTADAVVADGDCSLREAIDATNQTTLHADCPDTSTDGFGTNDRILLPAGTYTLTISGAGNNTNATGDLDVLRDLTITGTGNPTINQLFAADDRILHVPNVSDPLTLNNLTVSDGEATGVGAPNQQGGNILFQGDSNAELELNNVD